MFTMKGVGNCGLLDFGHQLQSGPASMANGQRLHKFDVHQHMGNIGYSWMTELNMLTMQSNAEASATEFNETYRGKCVGSQP